MNKKIIIKILLIVVMIATIILFFNKFELISPKNSSAHRDYKNKLIEVNKDKSISCNIYSGGLSSPYQNQYFMEYEAVYKTNNKNIYDRVNIKPKEAIESKSKFKDKFNTLKVVIKNEQGKVQYETPNLVKLDKNIGNKYLYPDSMYLEMNSKKELILNIPTYSNQLDFRFKYNIDGYDKNSSSHNYNVYKYNFKTKKLYLKKENNISYFYGLNRKAIVANQFNKYSNTEHDGVNSIIIYNGSKYYSTHENAKIFKELPKLKKYLETHKNVKQININFKDNISDDQIVEYLK